MLLLILLIDFTQKKLYLYYTMDLVIPVYTWSWLITLLLSCPSPCPCSVIASMLSPGAISIAKHQVPMQRPSTQCLKHICLCLLPFSPAPPRIFTVPFECRCRRLHNSTPYLRMH